MSNPQYVVAREEHIGRFEEKVTRLMAEGFTLHGSPYVEKWEESDGVRHWTHSQALVRYVPMQTVADRSGERIKLGNAEAILHSIDSEGGLGYEKHDRLNLARKLINEALEALK